MGNVKGAGYNRNNKVDGGHKPRYGVLGPKQASNHITWDELEAHVIMEAVRAVTEEGDAITFGKVRGGGALVLTVLSGDERHKAYFNSAKEAHDALVAIATAP